MRKYDNRIERLKIDIHELEFKIAKAIQEKKPAFAKRLNMILEEQKRKLQRWSSI